MIAWTKMIRSFYSPFHDDVENTLEHSERATGERELGRHPVSGRKVIARIGRFGPMIQIGDEQEDGEKARFASLKKDQSINSITLEEALQLFELPRLLGSFEDQEIKVNIGRFGPYVQHGKSFTSIPKGEDPMEISLERAIELLNEKRAAEANKTIKTFQDRDDVQLLNGKWGPYLKIGKNNFKLPKGKDASELTLEDCLEIGDSQSDKAKKTIRKKVK
jgi:DNA topoisomerase-1